MTAQGGAIMIRRLPVAPSPAPLEGYAIRFQDQFGAVLSAKF
jgi:hypothetical protein